MSLILLYRKEENPHSNKFAKKGMKTTGQALFTWPVIFRPLHDALIEDAFNKAARQLGLPAGKSDWSGWVRMLRFLLKKKARKTSA